MLLFGWFYLLDAPLSAQEAYHKRVEGYHHFWAGLIPNYMKHP